VDAAELDEKWTEFIETQGAAVEQEILAELEDTAHLFDVTDGTHAKWSPDGILGLLLVFSEQEAECLLAAFYAGMDGVDEAQAAFGVWVTSLMGMMRQCLTIEE
jgi:hypothetical protein|tara:strand:+ start:285 stop:596 length:312 start_codon:yes stop_codon:yes gene_type:complete